MGTSDAAAPGEAPAAVTEKTVTATIAANVRRSLCTRAEPQFETSTVMVIS